MARRVPAHELHRVVATCIVYNEERKFLIGKRPGNAAIFPNKWGVPGGGMSRRDYENLPQSLYDGWDDPLDIALRREIRQEMGIEVGDFKYVGNFSHIRPDNVAVLGLRFSAPYKSGPVKLNHEFVDYKWVRVTELSQYDFMGGIIEAIQRINQKHIYEILGRAAL